MKNAPSSISGNQMANIPIPATIANLIILFISIIDSYQAPQQRIITTK